MGPSRQAVGKPSDLVLSHPPYHNIFVYSGKVWGAEPHPDDLSRCATEEEFQNKLTIALKNQRHATKPGGHYGTIIGMCARTGGIPAIRRISSRGCQGGAAGRADQGTV